MPKEPNKKQNKDTKHFIKDFKAELKRVIWPTPKQLLNSTIAVVTIVLVTAIIVFALDFAFEKMNEYGIEKLKSVVETNNNGLNEEVSDFTNENAVNKTGNNTVDNKVAENTEKE